VIPAAAPADLDAIVLAGGRGSRAGGVDKPGLLVGGQALLAWVVAAACAAGAHRVVVVGPARPQALAGQPDPPGGLVTVREEPAGAGPVPALRCGLAEVAGPAVAVLAADLPFLRARHVRRLHAVLTTDGAGGHAGAVLTDDGGHPQWLAGCWRTGRRRAAVAGYGGHSLKGVLGPLAPVLLRYDLAAGEPPPWLDCDTAEDARRARAWQAAARRAGCGSEG
jgi:molybdopterin-guanine dinucleotide biosynthesis protein A